MPPCPALGLSRSSYEQLSLSTSRQAQYKSDVSDRVGWKLNLGLNLCLGCGKWKGKGGSKILLHSPMHTQSFFILGWIVTKIENTWGIVDAYQYCYLDWYSYWYSRCSANWFLVILNQAYSDYYVSMPRLSLLGLEKDIYKSKCYLIYYILLL